MLKHKYINSFWEGAGQNNSKKLEKKDTDYLFQEVLEVTSKLEFLLIIDDAEDLLRTSKTMLKEFIEILFENSSTIRVLITSKIEMVSFLGGISGVKGGAIKLKNLSQHASEKLLCEKAGRVITREEKNKLQNMEPTRVHGEVVKNAYQHLFDVILSGHPVAIGLAANIYSNSSLEFLYETLAKSSLLNTLAQGTIGKLTINEKLRFSLNLTLRIMQDKNVLIFFNLMGYFPGGSEEEAIDRLWPQVKKKATNPDWKQYFHFLVKASFMSKKKVKLNKEWREMYTLVPMLKTLAEESRSLNERKKVHKCVTLYYAEFLDEIMRLNSTTTDVNEKLMNNLWHNEMNIWDCIYRALEIKKNTNSVKTGSYKLDEYYESPLQTSSKFDGIDEDERAKIEEESGPLDDSDYEMILNRCKETDDEKQQANENNIIDGLIETLKPTLVPKKKELKDNDLLKLFSQGSAKPNLIKNFAKKINQKAKEPSKDEISTMIQRNIDKKLKKTVNAKVMNMITSHKELESINKPKEEIYRKIAHKIYEAQEEHKLYFGETINTVTVKGKKVKQVSSDAKVLILYISNLILFNKKTDAIKAIDEYGKYFYDKSLCEANLRKLKAVALLDTRVDLNRNGEVIQEFMKARIIFEQSDSDHGQALCCSAIGYMIYEYVLHFPGNKNDLTNYAKRKFVEALTFYERVEHKHGMAF